MDLDSVYEEQKITTGTVLFTYDVIWRPSNIHWASRWDIYLSMDNAVPDKVPGVLSSLFVQWRPCLLAWTAGIRDWSAVGCIGMRRDALS
jgi:hypothetical protein